MNKKDARTTPQRALLYVCDELRRCDVQLKYFLADTPERHAAMGISTTVTGYFACEWCTDKGFWDGSSVRHLPDAGAPLRTLEETKALAKSRFGQKNDKRKGVKKLTPLMELEGFDLFKQTPLDSMHHRVRL